MKKKKKDEDNEVISYLKKVGIARERGGALYDEDLNVGGSVKGAAIRMASMIKKVMKAKKTEVVTVSRNSLPRLFGMHVLEVKTEGRPPEFKGSVRERLRARGIEVRYAHRYGLVDFIRIEEKKY